MTPATATLAHSTATHRAARNWSANLRALSISHPKLVERLQPLPVAGEWVLARDGALTLLDVACRWLGECSVPYRAAKAILKTLDRSGTVACYLAPDHAAQIKAAFELLSPHQAVIVVQPDVPTLRTMLSCDDFSAELQASRLFFATGEDWTGELRAIFDNFPGLPTPQQFIRLPILPAELTDPLIAESQAVFAAVLADRAATIRARRIVWRAKKATPSRLGVIAGSRFSLWGDAGPALAEALLPSSAMELSRLDPDAPAQSSPLAVFHACEKCDAIVTPDTARCDFPNVVPDEQPWITWITRGRIPQAVSLGPNDSLIVADPSWQDEAIAKGWTANRVIVGGFPPLRCEPPPAGESVAKFQGWTIVCDTVAIEKPKLLEKFSSCMVLWEGIEHLLNRDPFAAGNDPAGYVRQHAKKAGVDESTLDVKLFLDSLLIPATAQGTVRELMRQRIPLRVFGAGWQNLADFASIAAGPIASRDGLRSAIASSTRLIHVLPGSGFHPIDSVGLPVLRRSQVRLDAFVQQVKQNRSTTPSVVPPISTDRVASLF